MKTNMILLGCMMTMLSCTPQKEKVSTIDSALQTKVDSILQDKINEINAISGHAIVMEVQTGEIKAMVGTGNHQESGLIRTASLLAALETNQVKLSDAVNVGHGVYMINDRALKDHNWHRGGYGEIDALKTLGIKITDFLVAPRIVALVLTIPILTLIADVLGILGGAVVGISFLDLSSTTYWDYSIKALTWNNTLIGILHSIIYGFIISICGCYEGIYSGRNADSVGKATTSAVVTALVWMIVATGILTVILEVAGL
jgi:hypothetical protein